MSEWDRGTLAHHLPEHDQDWVWRRAGDTLDNNVLIY